MIVNPFRIPGLNQSPLQPLNPWMYPEHDKLYVDVDNAAAAFASFQERFKDMTWVGRGALVVAAGAEQSGKSSLLNRCVYWLQSRSDDRHFALMDLRWVPAMAQQSTAERMRLVCRHLVNSLWHDRLLEDTSLRDRENPEDVLPYLPRVLPDSVILIVLLPQTADVADELVQYARLIPGRMMMLGETVYVDRLNLVRGHLDSTPVAPLILHVGPLRDQDGDTFYAQRRNLHPKHADIPEPSPGLLASLLRIKDMSIGELQRLLYEVYSEIADRPEPAGELTFELITDHYIRKTTFGSRR